MAENNIPSQIIVLGRGMEGPDPTIMTRERAEAAGLYAQIHPEVDQIIFSGGSSHVSKYGERQSEARVMADIAEIPHGIHPVIEENSYSTLSNFLNSARLLLDIDAPVGVVAHEAQMQRALYLGKRVLKTQIVPIVAEDLGAQPEPGNNLFGLAQLIKDKLVLAGVRSGDRERMRSRSKQEAMFVSRLGPIMKLLINGKSQYS